MLREHPRTNLYISLLHLLFSFFKKGDLLLYRTTSCFVLLDINTVISSYWSVLGMTGRQVVLGFLFWGSERDSGFCLVAHFKNEF